MSNYTWRTDAASGEVKAADELSAVCELIKQREWAGLDSDREAREIANGAWLTIFEDGLPILSRGQMP